LPPVHHVKCRWPTPPRRLLRAMCTVRNLLLSCPRFVVVVVPSVALKAA
jgi:hypothetical protein